MTLDPIWRTRLFASAGIVLGVVMGVLIANEALFWPTVCIGTLAAIIAISVQTQPLISLLLGGAIFGYIVGNRGFAQISLSSNFPLLPAEFVLLVGVTFLFVQSAWRRELPFRRDFINIALLLWIILGTVRLFFGVRSHGFAAVRDYAMVYYGLFFFLAQHVAREPDGARFLHRCMLAACAAQLLVYPLFAEFPGFFTETLTVRGVPVIFVKGDLAGNFMALGSLLYYAQFERTRKLRWLLLSVGLALLMLTTSSRSSMVALAVGAGWFALAGRWRFASVLGVGSAVAVIGLIVLAEAQNQPLRDTPLYRVYERTLSIADPLGQRAYQTEDAFKGDNNIFRLVWWQAVIDETLADAPWFGLGFGHDLAMRFVRQYYPEAGEDFTARSPHNILITIFARMGTIGLAAFVLIITGMAARTWKTLRANATVAFTAGAYWCGAWAILVAACFGVVLEGPMGAVVFWTVLGLANATTIAETESPESPSPSAGALPSEEAAEQRTLAPG